MRSSSTTAVARTLAGIATLVLVAAVGTAAAARARPRGNVRVLALIPPPGYPALPHLLANKIYEGTYDDPLGTSMPSRVLQYTSFGELLDSWTVRGQDTSQSHGVQVAANTARGKLLLLDKTSGRIIRLDPNTGRQKLYGRVPHIPPCSNAPPGSECKDSTQDLAPMPDYAAWGPDGSLYVTDYQQATIWRVPPGGGTAKVWLTSPRLDGGQFGTACIVMLPNHRTLLFDQASNGGLGSLNKVAGSFPGNALVNPTTGKLYEIAIKPGGRPGTMRELWESGPADAPDGCALTTTGHIFVALAGASNQIVELDAAGHQLARFGQQFTGQNNSSVPFDTPSGLACLGKRLIVANQAYVDGNSSNMALLDLQTGERCAGVYVPAAAGTRSARHAKRKHKPARRAHAKARFTG